MEININCDLGESSKFCSTENDPLLLKIVNSANIACGYHAGDKSTMLKTIKISKENNVSIGAHPSFNDPENFGRKKIYLSNSDITKLIFDQYEILQKVAEKHKEIVTHIKPHGALNNMACEDFELASIIAKSIYEIDKNLIDIINHEERLMPHLHLSIQSGDNIILKRMKRRHSREDVINLCNNLKKFRNNIVFGADIIAGFPTETNEMFLNSKKILSECDLTYLHIFPYSNRPNTPASKMPQISNEIIKERAKLLRTEGDKILQKFLKKQVNKKHKILFESETEGHSENFVPIKTLTKNKTGEIAMVKGKKVINGKLISQVM